MWISLNSLNCIAFREFLDHKVQFQLIIMNYLNNLGHIVQSGRSFAALRLMFLISTFENDPNLSLWQVSKMMCQAQWCSITASSFQNQIVTTMPQFSMYYIPFANIKHYAAPESGFRKREPFRCSKTVIY